MNRRTWKIASTDAFDNRLLRIPVRLLDAYIPATHCGTCHSGHPFGVEENIDLNSRIANAAIAMSEDVRAGGFTVLEKYQAYTFSAERLEAPGPK